MLIRIMTMLSLLNLMGSGYSSYDTPEDESMGGEGFGGVVQVVAFLGVLVLIGLVILGIMAVTGQFTDEFADPVT